MEDEEEEEEDGVDEGSVGDTKSDTGSVKEDVDGQTTERMETERELKTLQPQMKDSCGSEKEFIFELISHIKNLITSVNNINKGQLRHKRNIVYFGKEGGSQEMEVLKSLHTHGNETQPNKTVNNVVRIDQEAFLRYFALKYPQAFNSNVTTPSKEILEHLKNALISNSSLLVNKEGFKKPNPKEMKVIYKEVNSSKIKIDTFTRVRRQVHVKQADHSNVRFKSDHNNMNNNVNFNGDNSDTKSTTDATTSNQVSNAFRAFLDKFQQIKCKENNDPFNNFVHQFKTMKEIEVKEKAEKENYNQFVNKLKKIKYEEEKYGEKEPVVTSKNIRSEERVLADVRYNLARAIDFREKELEKAVRDGKLTTKEKKKGRLKKRHVHENVDERDRKLGKRDLQEIVDREGIQHINAPNLTTDIINIRDPKHVHGNSEETMDKAFEAKSCLPKTLPNRDTEINVIRQNSKHGNMFPNINPMENIFPDQTIARVCPLGLFQPNKENCGLVERFRVRVKRFIGMNKKKNYSNFNHFRDKYFERQPRNPLDEVDIFTFMKVANEEARRRKSEQKGNDNHDDL
uniref:Uncharacterized protein n=1 Tax=Cacopsylla melanoneura TaxID=428564 RepID=A0A8D8SSY1_9HEMI